MASGNGPRNLPAGKFRVQQMSKEMNQLKTDMLCHSRCSLVEVVSNFPIPASSSAHLLNTKSDALQTSQTDDADEQQCDELQVEFRVPSHRNPGRVQRACYRATPTTTAVISNFGCEIQVNKLKLSLSLAISCFTRGSAARNCPPIHPPCSSEPEIDFKTVRVKLRHERL